MARVAIATLRRPRGNKGELAATPLSDHPDRFAYLKNVFVGDRVLDIERTWWHGEDVVFKFAGIDSITAAEALAGLDVEIPFEERIVLGPGEYYLSDLVGCEVFDRGDRLGVVSGWQEIPGQVLIEVDGIEIPYLLVNRVDLTARRIDVSLPEGLKDLNA